MIRSLGLRPGQPRIPHGLREGDTGPHLGFDLLFPGTHAMSGGQDLSCPFAGDDDDAASSAITTSPGLTVTWPMRTGVPADFC